MKKPHSTLYAGGLAGAALALIIYGSFGRDVQTDSTNMAAYRITEHPVNIKIVADEKPLGIHHSTAHLETAYSRESGKENAYLDMLTASDNRVRREGVEKFIEANEEAKLFAEKSRHENAIQVWLDHRDYNKARRYAERHGSNIFTPAYSPGRIVSDGMEHYKTISDGRFYTLLEAYMLSDGFAEYDRAAIWHEIKAKAGSAPALDLKIASGDLGQYNFMKEADEIKRELDTRFSGVKFDHELVTDIPDGPAVYMLAVKK